MPLTVALALSALPSHAQAPAGDDDAVRLDTLVVTGAAPESPLTFALDPKLPRQPVPASDGADFLKTVPGFNAIRSGGTNGDPTLRGLSGSRLNLQIGDGALHGACPARMDNSLSYVSPETYDRVVIVKGPQTVIWGPVGSAGTVRFERDPPNVNDDGWQLDASALIGSHGRNDQIVDGALGNDRIYTRISANHARADDYDDGGGNPVPSRWMKWNVDAELGWMPGENTHLALTLGSGDGYSRYGGRGMDGTQFRRDSGSLRWQQRNLTEHLVELDVRVFRHDVDHVMDNYGLRNPSPHSMMPMPMVAAVDRRSNGGRAAATWRRDALELVAGIDQQDSRHRQRSGVGIGAHHGRPWETDATFSQYGAFAEASYRRNELTRWVGGLRADRARARDRRAGDHHAPNPTHGQRRSDTLPAGFVRLEHSIADSPMGLYAGIGHTARFPDYWELFSASNGPMHSANAFAGVKPERTTQIDVGLDYQGERARAWLSAYVGRVADFIVFDYRNAHGGHGTGHGGGSTTASNIDARIRGGELGLEWQATDALRLAGNIAYAWGQNRDDDTPLPQVAPPEARVNITWQRGAWSLGGLARVVAAQKRSAPGFGNVVGQDIGDSSGFAIMSANASYAFGERIRLSAGVDNLFDRTYSEHLNLAGDSGFGFPADPVRINEPGRTFWLKLDFRH